MVNNIRIGVKLIGAFVALALIAGIVGAVGYFSLVGVAATYNDVTEVRMPSVKELGVINEAHSAIAANQRALMLRRLTDPQLRQDHYDAVAAAWERVDTAWRIYEPLEQTPEEARLWQQFVITWDKWKADHEDIMRLLRERDRLIAAGADPASDAVAQLDDDAFATYLNARQSFYDAEEMLNALIVENYNAAVDADLAADAQSATAQTTIMIVIVVAIVAALGVGIYLSRSITGPLAQGVLMMQEMEQGHLSIRLRMSRKDEIGVLAQAMDRFAHALQTEVVGALQRAAAGDLNFTVQARDAQDEIAPALIQMRDAVQGLVAESRMLTQAAIEGKLATRGDASKFQGSYRDVVQGVNDTLDAVIGPLNVAAEYVERISKGDIPQPLTDEYRGDFNEIKNNLNVCIAAVNALIADANMLSRAAIEGKLATRADASRHQGEFRKIVQGVNDTLDAVIGPLNVAADYVNQIANGVIPEAITTTYQGDFDLLKRNLNTLSARLREMLGGLLDAANNLSAASAEILSSTTQQASGATEQSAAISQTTTTVDEVKTIAEQSAARAQEVANASQRTVEVSRTGQRAVKDTIESMNSIKERVEGIAENILALSEQTQQIGEIIASVNEIAAQSNMLALNASIEAARAGEYGKGFAVVAMEVRNLAEQSRQATAQVKTILSEIQKATNATVMATEEGTKGVDEGVQLASQAQQSIEQLYQVINESAQAATQVLAGGRQQVAGVEQVATAMQNINQATVQSLASTRQAEKAAQNLNALAAQLTGTVKQYKFNGAH